MWVDVCHCGWVGRREQCASVCVSVGKVSVLHKGNQTESGSTDKPPACCPPNLALIRWLGDGGGGGKGGGGEGGGGGRSD